MATISQALEAAVRYHQTGNLPEAERLYREILKREPRHPDALHLLGLVAYAQGDFAGAVEQIHQAIEADAAQHTFHNHLAEAYRALDRLADALASCRRALALKADYAIGHNTLGTVQQAAGDLAGAESSFLRAIALDPEFAQAYFNLGLVQQSGGQVDEALASYRQAIHCKNDYALALAHLATLLQTQSRYAEAIEVYRQALVLSPHDAEMRCNLGSAYKDQGRTGEAIESYRRALAISPDLAQANFNLGVIFQGQNKLDNAADCYRRAIRDRPDYAEAHSNLGTVYKFQGKLRAAMGCYEEGLRCRDDLSEGHRNRALLRLLLGDFHEGWPEYEWRWRVPSAKRIEFAQPRWQGEPLAGGTVLVVTEQGLGDTIQFIRYAPLVKERSQGQVLLQCPAALVALLKNVAGVDRIVTSESLELPFDRYIPIMSLPAVFGTLLDTIPCDVPYLSVERERLEHWQRELSRYEGFKVGIGWQGNPGYLADAERSIPLAQFAALASCAGVRLFSLQKRHGVEQLGALAERLGIVDLGPLLDEQGGAFVDTAAVMKNLDLVITSDTAIAHLAGALGVKVWVALPSVPDWRWLLEREDSPWYPSMRLFRQSVSGDWSGVFARMAGELASLSSGRSVG